MAVAVALQGPGGSGHMADGGMESSIWLIVGATGRVPALEHFGSIVGAAVVAETRWWKAWRMVDLRAKASTWTCPLQGTGAG